MCLIKARINNIDEAAEFFLRRVHALELCGEIQKAVIEYRVAKGKGTIEGGGGGVGVMEDTEELFHKYHVMLSDLYREELEHWINENQVIHMSLKSR